MDEPPKIEAKQTEDPKTDTSPDVCTILSWQPLVFLHETRPTKVFGPGALRSDFTSCSFSTLRNSWSPTCRGDDGRSYETKSRAFVWKRLLKRQVRYSQIRSERKKCWQTSKELQEDERRGLKTGPNPECVGREFLTSCDQRCYGKSSFGGRHHANQTSNKKLWKSVWFRMAKTF